MAQRVRAPYRNRRGFTLTEIIVVISILGVVLAGLLTALMTGTSGYLTSVRQSDVMQQNRAAMLLMTSEIRQAGLDPKGVRFPAIVNPTATSFTLRNDWPGSGDQDADPDRATTIDGFPRGDLITYTYDARGRTITRSESAVSAASPIIQGVHEVIFEYFDAAGTRMDLPIAETDWDKIRAMGVSITTESDRTGWAANRAVIRLTENRIRLWNR